MRYRQLYWEVCCAYSSHCPVQGDCNDFFDNNRDRRVFSFPQYTDKYFLRHIRQSVSRWGKILENADFYQQMSAYTFCSEHSLRCSSLTVVHPCGNLKCTKPKHSRERSASKNGGAVTLSEFADRVFVWKFKKFAVPPQRKFREARKLSNTKTAPKDRRTFAESACDLSSNLQKSQIAHD